LDLAKKSNASSTIITLLTEDGVSAVETDVFCSHAWGRDNSTHKQVVALSEFLESHGIRTWIDKERLKGDIVRQMTRGIDLTKVVLVFITKAYLEKVASSDQTDNCKLEFQYAASTKSGATGLLPVLLDPDFRNTSDWTGPVGFFLGKSLYVDLTATQPERLSEQKDELLRRIQEKLDALKKPENHLPHQSKFTASQVTPMDSLDTPSKPISQSDRKPSNELMKDVSSTAKAQQTDGQPCDVRGLLRSKGVNESLIEILIKEGYDNLDDLRALAHVSVADLKSIFGFEKMAQATRLKDVLTSLFRQETTELPFAVVAGEHPLA
jgi:hypothetical protein